ncbi:MAG: hypothetical protein IT379_33255 [Deltaproteobacteria bacterium]|nr:hypothetical protein [Deltaproteobacteria bacterium]
MTRSYDSLLRTFRKLEAPEPESWARGEARENLPELARLLFLKQAWTLVIAEDDAAWMQEWMRPMRPDEPLAGMQPALERLRARGADVADLNTLVRGMQFRLLDGLCRLLEDAGYGRPEATRDAEREVDRIDWALFELDEDGQPARKIAGLADAVMSLDPTGREMRPRKERDDSTRRTQR